MAASADALRRPCKGSTPQNFETVSSFASLSPDSDRYQSDSVQLSVQGLLKRAAKSSSVRVSQLSVAARYWHVPDNVRPWNCGRPKSRHEDDGNLGGEEQAENKEPGLSPVMLRSPVSPHNKDTADGATSAVPVTKPKSP
jgi:hypothetical protein